MAVSQQDKTPHKSIRDVCRLCDITFTDKRDKHNLIIGAREVKPAYTSALEELTGPVNATDDLIAVCGSCRNLLNRYHRCSCEVKRIGALVRSMSRAHSAARCAEPTPTDDDPVRKRIKIEHEDLAISQIHLSVFSLDEIPAVERCTTCCSQFHCPLCPKHLFKPSKPSRVRQHLEVHIKNAITFEDKKICRCNLTCRNGGHYHCPICDTTVIRRTDMEAHVKSCAIQQTSTSAAAQSNPSQDSSFLSLQPSPSASPSPDLLVQQSIQTSSIIHSSADTQLSSLSPLISSFVETEKLKKVDCPLCSVTCLKKNLAKHMQRKHP
ncbi:uncharacterized protein LOC131993753 [Centropristis striata]|uniref:uncharacterized protein LOC131993753 n=1 Tax=Centropristis striata TaxID=184440 RepID=UPI0027E12D4C|nr:uncharacterized protein LOC131993753 [Centropristis striata]